MDKAFKCNKKNTIKVLCYILCTLILSLVNQQKGSAGGPVQQVIAPNFAIASLALFFIPSLDPADFKRKRYLAWIILNILFVAVSGICFRDMITAKYNIMQWYGGALSVFVWGALLIYAISSISERFHNGTKFMIIFREHRFQLIMSIALLLFSVSANISLWPVQYLLVYTTMVLIDIDDEDRALIVRSIENGILISFFIIQGLAFVFRPYDDVRYKGLFANPNVNALFYLSVYCCFLVKYCEAGEIPDTKKRTICRCVSLAFSGAMWSFVFLTGSRCTLLAMAAVTIITAICIIRRSGKGIIKTGAGYCMGLLLWMLISFPVVFGAVRFIPAVFHHPIWFMNEYCEQRVHSFDPWDSDKYVDIQELLENNYGRFFKISTVSEIQESLEESEPISNDSVSIRALIYRSYLQNLNLRGHRIGGGLVISDGSYSHAQNLYLMMAYDHGVIAAVVFMVFTLAYPLLGFIHLMRNESDKNNNIYLFSVIFYASLLIFGQLEMMWLCGELPFTMLFVLPAVWPVKSRKNR